MKQTIDNHTFHRAFEDCGRGSQFSENALNAIFEFYQDWEDSTGEEVELDVVAICCDWTEYGDVIEAYNELIGDCVDVSGDEALEALQDRTTVLELTDGVVVGNF